jgi:hypothetical protein
MKTYEIRLWNTFPKQADLQAYYLFINEDQSGRKGAILQKVRLSNQCRLLSGVTFSSQRLYIN